MANITITPTGAAFDPTDTVTSTRLNEARNPAAALVPASIGTADIADNAITPALIADNAITPALIADNAITTPAILDANVTFAKLTDVIDDDTMATATDTTLATSESIKAYVDGGFTPSTYAGEESVTLPNGLIMKMGYSVGSTGTVTFSTAFTTSLLSVCITIKDTAAQSTNATVTADSSTAFTYASAGGTTGVFWQAIGY